MTMQRHFGEHHDEILATFATLKAAWMQAEPKHPITVNFTSYSESFLDMARAVVAERYAASPPVRVESERVAHHAVWRDGIVTDCACELSADHPVDQTTVTFRPGTVRPDEPRPTDAGWTGKLTNGGRGE